MTDPFRVALEKIVAETPADDPGPYRDEWGHFSEGNYDDVASDVRNSVGYALGKIARDALALLPDGEGLKLETTSEDRSAMALRPWWSPPDLVSKLLRDFDKILARTVPDRDAVIEAARIAIADYRQLVDDELFHQPSFMRDRLILAENALSTPPQSARAEGGEAVAWAWRWKDEADREQPLLSNSDPRLESEYCRANIGFCEPLGYLRPSPASERAEVAALRAARGELGRHMMQHRNAAHEIERDSSPEDDPSQEIALHEASADAFAEAVKTIDNILYPPTEEIKF